MIMLIATMSASAATPNITIEVDGEAVVIPSDTVELGLFIYDLDAADQQIIIDDFTDAIDAIADEDGDITPEELHGIYQDLAYSLSADLSDELGDEFLALDAMSIIGSAVQTENPSDWRAEWGNPGMKSMIPLFMGDEPEPEYSIFSKTMALGGVMIGGALGMAAGGLPGAAVGAVAGAKAGEATGEAIENYAEGRNEGGEGDED